MITIGSIVRKDLLSFKIYIIFNIWVLNLRYETKVKYRPSN